MSNETELQNRMEEAIRAHAHPTDQAQAIIDDLGLTVVSDGGRPEWRLQIVGKWERA